MGAPTNGRLVEADVKPINGKPLNSHAKAPKSKAPPKKNGGFSLFSTISRLLTWYSIISIFFRCPLTPDLLTDTSPKICKPYFQLKSAITPYVEPYYNTYAAPYVEAVRPHYETADKKVFTPAISLGKKYGAPRLAQAQAYGQAQWEKNLRPKVTKYQGIAKGKYDETLGPHVDQACKVAAPYWEIVKTNALQTYYGHIVPTYKTVQPYALEGYLLASEFTINTAIPYTKWAWSTSYIFLERTIWPQIRILYGENVEPQLVRIGERLGRYRDGKKLKAVVDAVRSTTSLAPISSTTSSAIPSTEAVQSTSPPSSTAEATIPVSSKAAPENIPLTEAEIREKAAAVVANDLRTWQEKFAKAADEGADELEQRMTEVTQKLIDGQAQGVGKALTVQLEETVSSSLKSLKKNIISIIENSEDIEESEEEIFTAVRKAGIVIKDKAQAVRTWRQNFDAEAESLVSKAAEDTFEILDYIRDLGLQEIGMRWAWTDGITHKDWAKYHQLKGKFDEWRVDVEKVVTEHPGISNVRHASEEVETAAMEIAERAAKELASLKETGRWKLDAEDTSDDWSPKYLPAGAAVVGKKIKQKIDDAKEAVAPSSQGTVESIASVASSSVVEAASSASSYAASQVGNAQSIASSVSGIAPGTQGTIESVISAVSSGASSIASDASSAVIGTKQGIVESIASVAKASAESLADQASSAAIGTQQGTVESIASVATEGASSLSAKASSSLYGEEPGVAAKATDGVKSASSAISNSASSLSDVASSSISAASSLISSATSSIASSLSDSAIAASSSMDSAASSASSTASSKVWGGAMAQHVEAREIVLDDDETYSEKLQSLASEAGDKYAEITKAVSEALLRPSSAAGYQVTELAAQQYSSALAAASSALYGPEKGTGEVVASAAASRYADAVSAASSIIYGTPAPVTDSIASSARDAYSSAISRASAHYSQARSVVSAQISGEPKPVHEQMYSSVEAAFSDSVAAANSRLQAAVSSVSTAVYGTPPSALESASSLAQSKLSEGLAAASSRFKDAKEYAAAITTGAPQKQKLLLQIQEQYYAGVGMAHARYSEFIEAASSAVMPTPSPSFGYSAALAEASSSYASVSSLLGEKAQAVGSQASSAVYGSEIPVVESLASKASENWEALITKASEQIYGATTPYFVTRSLLSEAKEYGAQATDAASSQYFVVQSIISELVIGKEPAFTESVYNKLSSVYYTGAKGAVSSASSYASEAYASASSVVVTVFTPPPSIEIILDSASSRLNEAVEAASIQLYGSQKGAYEQATSSAASVYSSAQSVASEKIYGTTTGYAEAASKSISEAAASAQSAISEAIYGTATGHVESITSAVADTYSSATSAAGEAYASAQAKVSEAIYGPEKGAVESAQARLSSAVESARVKLAEFAASAGEGASEIVSKASEGVEEFASSVGSAVSSATAQAKDEL